MKEMEGKRTEKAKKMKIQTQISQKSTQNRG